MNPTTSMPTVVEEPAEDAPPRVVPVRQRPRPTGPLGRYSSTGTTSWRMSAPTALA